MTESETMIELPITLTHAEVAAHPLTDKEVAGLIRYFRVKTERELVTVLYDAAVRAKMGLAPRRI